MATNLAPAISHHGEFIGGVNVHHDPKIGTSDAHMVPESRTLPKAPDRDDGRLYWRNSTERNHQTIGYWCLKARQNAKHLGG